MTLSHLCAKLKNLRLCCSRELGWGIARKGQEPLNTASDQEVLWYLAAPQFGFFV